MNGHLSVIINFNDMGIIIAFFIRSIFPAQSIAETMPVSKIATRTVESAGVFEVVQIPIAPLVSTTTIESAFAGVLNARMPYRFYLEKGY